MEKQDRTMQDLNKSEEQKASERQRLEIERRRKSAENPFEKAAAMSRGKFYLWVLSWRRGLDYVLFKIVLLHPGKVFKLENIINFGGTCYHFK